MKNNLKRLLAMFLAVMMVVGTFTIPVFAEDVAPEKPDPETCVHEWRFEKTVDPTCVTQGYDLEYCPICYEYRQVNVTDPNTDHTWVESEAVDATCAAAGHSAGKVCSVCGALGDGVIEYPKRTQCGTACDADNNKHDITSADCIHTWKGSAAGNPCLDAIEVTYKCTCCGIEIKTNTDGKGHTYKYFEDTLEEPECDTDGKIQRGCEFGCEDALHWVTIIAPGHKYDKVNPGEDTGKCSVECSVCHDVKVGSEVHEWDAEKHVDPDCVNTGKDVCKKCGYVLTIAANGHTYAKDKNGKRIPNEDSVAPVCGTETNGVNYYECTECDYVDEVEVEFEHRIDTYTYEIPATCVFPGIGVGRCDVCGNIAQENFDPTGHTKNDDPDFEGNCVDGGFKVYTCTVCGEEFKEAVAPGTHEYVDILDTKYPAKCGTDGWKNAKECMVCGHIDGEVVPMPYDHEYVVFYTYGKGCLDVKLTYSHCKNEGCEYNCTKKPTDFPNETAYVAKLNEFYDAGLIRRDSFGPADHDYSEEEELIVKPTCSDTGWWGFKCDRCEAVVETHVEYEYNKENHTGAQYLVDFRWTCSAEQGARLYSQWYCVDCKSTYDSWTYVPAAGLNLEVGKMGVVVNVGELGLLEYETLVYENTAEAGAYLKSITIFVNGVGTSMTAVNMPATNNGQLSGKDHVWKDGDIALENCGKEVEVEQTCIFCQAKNTKKVSATDKDHNVKTWTEVTPSTCDKTGTEKGTCENCGNEITRDIKKKDHKFTVVIEDKYQKTPASCTAKAVYWKACEVCGATDDAYTFEHGEMLAHTYDANVKCVVKDCDHKDVTKCTYYAEAATCIVGTKYYVSCSVCGESSKGKGDDEATFEDKADLAKHTPSATKKDNPDTQPAQCENYWYAQYDDCTVCGIVLNWYGFVPQVEHELNYEKTDANYVKPTCIMLGYWKYDCKYCNKTLETEIDVESQNASHKNSHGEDITGNCKYVASYKCKVVHTFDENGKITNPCKESDYVTDANGAYVRDYICSVCGEEVLPDQHVWEADPEGNVYDCGVKDEKCVVCGIKRHNTEGAEHTWVKDEENSVDPTFDTEGVYVEKCSAGCGAKTEPEKLGKLPSLVFSLEIANPNGGDIVTGGKAYLTIKIDAVDVDVTSVCLKLNVSKYLKNVQVVADDYALGGYVVAHANASNVVTVWADANSEQKFVNLDGEYVLCVLAFDVVYDGMATQPGIIDNDLLKTSVNFVEPVVDDPKTEAVEEDPQIMVLNPSNERETFDVTAFNKIDVEINQIADANDDAVVNSQDALIIRQAIEARLAGTEGYEYDSVLDINKDGEIGTADYILVMQYIIGALDYADLVAAQPDAE